MDLDSLSLMSEFAGVGAVMLAFGIFAGMRERGERRRRDLDRISTVPWGLISVLSSILAIISLSTAAKLYFAGV